MTIIELAAKYDVDKKMDDGKKAKHGVYGHNYAKHYDSWLPQFDIKSMLEIGVNYGDSIRMWYDYFPNTMIYGMDINENRCKKSEIENERIKLIIGDQGNRGDLEAIDANFDFIVDDGSHKTHHQLLSFDVLWKKLRPKGLYVVEDLHVGNFESEFIPPQDMEEMKYLERNKIVFIRKK